MRHTSNPILPLRSVRLARWCALGVGAVCALSALSAAQAHNFTTQRRAIFHVRPAPLQAADAGLSVRVDRGVSVEALVMLEIQAGPRVAALTRQHDIDRSGTFNPVEALALAGALSPELLGGYAVEIDGEAGRLRRGEVRAERTPDGGLVVAALLRYDGPDGRWAPGATHRVRIPRVGPRDAPKSDTRASGVAPLTLEIQLSSAVRPLETSHPLAHDAPVLGPVELAAGADDVWVTARVQTP